MAGFSARFGEPVDVEMVPHPALTMVFNLGDEPLVVDDGTGRHLRERVVAGLAPGGARGRAAGGFDCLQVRLSPVFAHAVLDGPVLGAAVVSLDDLWAHDAVSMQERLRAATSWDQRFAIAEAALAGRRAAGRTVDPQVAFAWRALVQSGGQVRVERLATALDWSRKRLWSRFRSQIGLTPKRAAQLIRFDYAAHRLAVGESAALVAAESGYADQSHLHRDTRIFASATPLAVASAPWLAVDEVAWPRVKHTAGTFLQDTRWGAP